MRRLAVIAFVAFLTLVVPACTGSGGGTDDAFQAAEGTTDGTTETPDVGTAPCCEPRNGPGCPADAAVEKCVCAKDALCCSNLWDSSCVDEVDSLGCGRCCVPACAGKACGDDGCGGTCGTCPAGSSCANGACTACSCGARQCGDDGCGTPCGTCDGAKLCDPVGQCVTPSACGVCAPGLACGAAQDVPEWCFATSCGDVPEAGRCVGDLVEFCQDGGLYSIACDYLSQGANTCAFDVGTGNFDCVCRPSCGGKACGDDLCGGSCGKCGAGNTCQAGACGPCSCTGKTCGDDGCGVSCGICGEGTLCGPDGHCATATDCGVCGAGLACGATVASPTWCSAAGCGAVDEVGRCDGDLVTFCDGTTLFSIDCAFLGKGLETCRFDPEVGGYNCACKPQCAGRLCGDDGCGGTCGLCATGQYCTLEGICDACSCAGRQCGDDGCGTACGNCAAGRFCDWQGQCRDAVISACCATDAKPGCAADAPVAACVCAADPYCCEAEWDTVCVHKIQNLKCGVCCIPECGGKACGDDGCGGSCGYCTGNSWCAPSGACTPCSCGGRTCGEDQCGTSCGTCAGGSFCNPAGACETCTCSGKPCGDDGCGTSCGTCPGGEVCQAGQCVTPTLSLCCDTTDAPGCAAEPAVETCVCAEDEYCCTTAWDDYCVSEVGPLGCGFCCMPDCKGRTCGDDGCGGSCGECTEGQGCNGDGLCIACECLPGQDCGPDTCGKPVCGSCGAKLYCGPENLCLACGCGAAACGTGPCGEDCGSCPTGYCDQGQCQAFVGGCCAAKDTAGCTDDAVAKCVCDHDPFCCDTKWDKSCVAKVQSLACGTCP